MIVILTQDLMMSSSVSSVARARDLTFKSATNLDRVIKLTEEQPISVLLIDLQFPNLDLGEIMNRVAGTGATLPRMIAYAQHVNVDLLSAARKAGINEVYTRGQVYGNLESLLAEV